MLAKTKRKKRVLLTTGNHHKPQSLSDEEFQPMNTRSRSIPSEGELIGDIYIIACLQTLLAAAISHVADPASCDPWTGLCHPSSILFFNWVVASDNVLQDESTATDSRLPWTQDTLFDPGTYIFLVLI